MKKHNKMTAPERDQIAWWLACGVTIREMARRLAEVYATKVFGLRLEFRRTLVSKRLLFDTHCFMDIR
jgi:IS30 family transposase